MTLSIFVHEALYGSRKYLYPMEGIGNAREMRSKDQAIPDKQEREREGGGGVEGGAGSVKKFSSRCSVYIFFFLAF